MLKRFHACFKKMLFDLSLSDTQIKGKDDYGHSRSIHKRCAVSDKCFFKTHKREIIHVYEIPVSKITAH